MKIVEKIRLIPAPLPDSDSSCQKSTLIAMSPAVTHNNSIFYFIVCFILFVRLKTHHIRKINSVAVGRSGVGGRQKWSWR